MILSVTGCGSNKAEIPELKEPKTTDVVYRPVTKRIVGKIQYLYGTVVPTDYPIFSENGASIKEIYVGVGDYVEKGDVVASCYNGDIDEKIERLESDINVLLQKRACAETVGDETVERIDYEKKMEKFLKNKKGVKAKETESEIEQENTRYSIASIDSQIASIREEIDRIQAKNTEQIFEAPHSGYVTYVKDVTQSNYAAASENILVISDTDDLYIEVPGLGVHKYLYEKYKSKWINYNGKMVEITEHKYTNTELSFALSVDRNPPVAFDAMGADLACGGDVVLYFMQGKATPCLSVGNDSIYRENGEEFVYVKGSGKENEKRTVILGDSDGLYTQVKSGLEEGELVAYNNTAAPPTKQDIAVASVTDYREIGESDYVDFAYPYYDIYVARCDGLYQKIQDLGTASAGDSLFAIESLVESADTERARLEIANMDNERAKAEKEYEKEKEKLTKEVNKKDKFNKKTMATDTDAVYKYMYRSDRAKCDLDILEAKESLSQSEYSAGRYYAQLDYDKMLLGTGSSGEYSDYLVEAPSSGRVTSVIHVKDEKLQKGQFVMSLERRFKDPEEEDDKTRLLIFVSTSGKGKVTNTIDDTAKVGTDVTLIQENKSWKGKCIGINGVADRYTLFTRDGEAHSTYSKPFVKSVTYQFFVEMDSKLTEKDLKDVKIQFVGNGMDKVVTVPSICIKTEIDQLSLDERNYVWKLEGDQVVKEYVEIHKSSVANGVTYVLKGVEPGDKVLK